MDLKLSLTRIELFLVEVYSPTTNVAYNVIIVVESFIAQVGRWQVNLTPYFIYKNPFHINTEVGKNYTEQWDILLAAYRSKFFFS